MDHLPHDIDPLHIEVPYLCTEPYAPDGAWINYPEKHGIPLENLREGKYGRYSSEIMMPFLQNWLYFGVIQEVLPFKLELEHFIIEKKENLRIVTTRKLPEYLERWRENSKSLSEEQRLQMWQKNVAILEVAFSFISIICNWPEGMTALLLPFNPIIREISLSMAFLGRALDLANQEILNPGAGNNSRSWSGSLLLEHIEAQGWCPFLIARFGRVVPLETIHYAATMGSPHVKRNHRECSDDGCLYKAGSTQHTTSKCSCQMLSPDVSKMRDIIEQKKLPLVRFETTGEGDLKVLAGDAGATYVAMSHVWSDGLGNFVSNSMPQCQFSRIQEAVDSLYPKEKSIPFWMDTILIPNQEEFLDIKEAAIHDMTQIYKKADKVLVIDSELITCSIHSSHTAIAIRILLSNWLRRLWTLQEGVFANEIHFLLSDETVSLSSLLHNLPPDPIGLKIKNSLMRNFTDLFDRTMRTVGVPSAPPAKQVTQVGALQKWIVNVTKTISAQTIFFDVLKRAWLQFLLLFNLSRPRSHETEGRILACLRAVVDRTSTFTSDEALCLALLLGIDPRPILAAMAKSKSENEKLEQAKSRIGGRAKEGKPDAKIYTALELANVTQHSAEIVAEEPMLTFFKLINGTIPLGILLLPGPRNETAGYRWAPKSFLVDESRRRIPIGFPSSIVGEYPSQRLITRPCGVLCEEGRGIKVMFPGLFLKKIHEKVSLNNHFIVDTLDGSLEKEIIQQGKPPRFWLVLYAKDEGGDMWDSMAPNHENSEEMAIFICSYGSNWRSTYEGLLVRLVKTELAGRCKALHVERVCRVLVRGTPVHDNHYWMTGPEQRVFGSWKPLTQTWCVD
jgi:hypothetical protein